MNEFNLILIVAQSGGFMGMSMGYWVIIGASLLASWLVSSTLKRRFSEYSQMRISRSGQEIAEMMLRENGIDDVCVVSVAGQLTDHYDPTTKTVNLSESVYQMSNVAAAAVAAHECGHAIQHARAYVWLGLRSKLVPVVSLASNMMNVVMILAIVGMFVTRNPILLWGYVACLGIVALFSVITLPVEFDASRRALAWIEPQGIMGSMEHDRAKNALFWAAMTYVVAALSSIATLLYYLSMLLGNRDE